MQSMHNVRAKACKASEKAQDGMVADHQAKRPPAKYRVGEEVFVKVARPDARVRCGGSKISRKPLPTGKIIEVDLLKHRYLLKYTGEQGRSRQNWHPVSNLTSVTREKEKVKKIQARTATGSGVAKASIHNLHKPALLNLGNSCWFNSTVQDAEKTPQKYRTPYMCTRS